MNIFFCLCHQLPTALLCLTSGRKPKLKVRLLTKRKKDLCADKKLTHDLSFGGEEMDY